MTTHTSEALEDIASELRGIARKLEDAHLTNFSRRVRAQADRIDNQTRQQEGGKAT